MAANDDDESDQPKPIVWVASSREDIQKFPKSVRTLFGQALFDAQTSGKHPDAKPLKGFGGAGVVEIVENDDGNTYRTVYTVRFAGLVYVLHAFQKKSKTGRKTPGTDIEKIRNRLKIAEQHYAEWKKDRENTERSSEGNDSL